MTRSKCREFSRFVAICCIFRFPSVDVGSPTGISVDNRREYTWKVRWDPAGRVWIMFSPGRTKLISNGMRCNHTVTRWKLRDIVCSRVTSDEFVWDAPFAFMGHHGIPRVPLGACGYSPWNLGQILGNMTFQASRSLAGTGCTCSVEQVVA